MNPIYPHKRIRTRSTRNVETVRLLSRLDYVREHIVTMARACEQKNQFRDIAREVVNIERELAHRGVEFVPVTNGRHLSVCPEVRVIYPPPGRAESLRRARAA